MGFAFKGTDAKNQGMDVTGQMRDLERFGHDLTARTKDGDHAFTFGNINTDCVHIIMSLLF